MFGCTREREDRIRKRINNSLGDILLVGFNVVPATAAGLLTSDWFFFFLLGGVTLSITLLCVICAWLEGAVNFCTRSEEDEE